VRPESNYLASAWWLHTWCKAFLTSKISLRKNRNNNSTSELDRNNSKITHKYHLSTERGLQSTVGKAFIDDAVAVMLIVTIAVDSR